MDQRRILVIAGSDSSGGAGLEADQRVIAVHKCYAMTTTTALTAQNTLGVRGIHHTPPEFVKQQIDACIEDIGVDVVKTGMLASAETIDIVADALERHGRPISVIDPHSSADTQDIDLAGLQEITNILKVMVATSGSQLLPQTAVRHLRLRLLPLTTILTPNIPEAKLLIQDATDSHNETIPIRGVEDIVHLTHGVQALGPQHVLVKGGHIPLTNELKAADSEAERKTVVNVLCSKDQVLVFRTRYQPSRNTHGTGCSLACKSHYAFQSHAGLVDA
ncbi:MAG: hypothetical protein Q9195_008699 [Heterodermia aff. obscurata]